MSKGQEKNAHILIVDDDSRVTSALRRTLAYEGYQVSSTLDGEGALAIARTKSPDLVILDLMLRIPLCDRQNALIAPLN